MTVLEGIQKSAEFLAKKDVDSPRLQAELLLAHVLKLPRMKLYLNFERALTDPETNAFRDLVKRRSQREPLQHIIGSTSFCGFEIAVNRHVLVPRPETEVLAELGWQFLNQLAKDHPPRVFELGTGSGCIAIALAAKCPSAKIIAADISKPALDVAIENAERNKVTGQIEFAHGPDFGALTFPPPAPPVDLIISNPPYIPKADIATLQPEVRDYDPREALDGGEDGLDFYRKFAIEAGRFLNPDGKIMLEFGDGQGDAIRNIFQGQKWIVEAIREDYTQRQRILIAGISH